MTGKIIITVLIVVLLLTFTVRCFADTGKGGKSYRSVSMAEGMKKMAASESFVLLDVRRPEEYKGGHIPGAVLLTNETMTPALAERLVPDKGKEVYVYCRSGRRSKDAAGKLVKMGYTNVIEIGGILDYYGQLEK